MLMLESNETRVSEDDIHRQKPFKRRKPIWVSNKRLYQLLITIIQTCKLQITSSLTGIDLVT